MSDKNREAAVKILNVLLSDEVALYIKTRKFHWNVTGPQFHDLHKFFESQYEELGEILDAVAERARSLGGVAYGTLREFAGHTRIEEAPGENPEAPGMITALLSDHEALIETLRKDLVRVAETCQDMGTGDFLTGLMEQHEKMAWMLRAFLE